MNAARLIDRATRLLSKNKAALAAIVPLGAVVMPAVAATFSDPEFAVVFFSGAWGDGLPSGYAPGTAAATTSPDGSQVNLSGQISPISGATWTAEEADGSGLSLFSRGVGIGTLKAGDRLDVNFDIDLQATGGTGDVFVDGFLETAGTESIYQTFPFSAGSDLKGNILSPPASQNIPVDGEVWFFDIGIDTWSGYAPSDEISLSLAGSTFSIVSVPEPFSASLLMLGSTLLLIRRSKTNRRGLA